MNNITPTPAHLAVESMQWGILKPLTFELNAGKTLGVLGANGSGKSSLLKILYRFNQPQKGKVFLDGDDLHKLPNKVAAQQVAAVLQESTQQNNLKAIDIIKLGFLPHLSAYKKTSPQQNQHLEFILDTLSLNHLVNRPFNKLSGGERQRVMIARALTQQPRLLILDEPTNHLDIRNQLELLTLIKKLNVTTIIALHDLNLANDYTDEVLILSKGYKIAHGQTQQTLNPDYIDQAFSVAAQRHQEDKFFTFSLN